MKNNLLKYCILIIVLLSSSMVVNATVTTTPPVTDIGKTDQRGLGSCANADCDSLWQSTRYQGVRVSLVYNTTFVGEDDVKYYAGERAQNFIFSRFTKDYFGDSTILSVDYSNIASTLNSLSLSSNKGLYFYGYNSKLDYLYNFGLKSLPSSRLGYEAKAPYGSLPDSISSKDENIDSSQPSELEKYFNNTFLNFNNDPANLIKLLNDLGAVDLVARIEKDVVNSKSIVTKETWANIQIDFPYALIVEPVIYATIVDIDLPDQNLKNTKVALTAIEAARLLPESGGTPFNTTSPGPGYCSVCWVTSVNLPRAAFTRSSWFKTQVNGKYIYPIWGGTDGFKNNDTFKRVENVLGNTWFLKMKEDIDAPTGLGMGVIDLWQNIDDYTPDPEPCVESPTVICKKEVVVLPSCSVSNACNKQSFFKDSDDWTKIIGNPDFINDTKGSLTTVTNWNNVVLVDNVLEYPKDGTLPGETTMLCPAYCRSEVTTGFPSAPDNGIISGTHFQFEKIVTTTILQCKADVQAATWLKDYDYVVSHLNVATLWKNAVLANARFKADYTKTSTTVKSTAIRQWVACDSANIQSLAVIVPPDGGGGGVDLCNKIIGYKHEFTCSGLSHADLGIRSSIKSIPSNTFTTEITTSIKKYPAVYEQKAVTVGSNTFDGTLTVTALGKATATCDYTWEKTMWEKTFDYYTTRLASLKSSIDACYNWNGTVATPKISVTHTQKTNSKDITTQYTSFTSKITNSTGVVPTKKICSATNISTSEMCASTRSYVAGNPAAIVTINMYNRIESNYSETREFSLPAGTNQYVLKPSGQVVSAKPTTGNYYDIGYPNYSITLDSPNNLPSGSLTINYSNIIGDKCSGVSGYGTYTCAYTGKIPRDSENYVYHAIDLKNPFTYYEDGTSRDIGFNWRYTPGLVEKFITSNRGVAGDAVYDLEPMYVVDFTGANKSKLSEIRLYNKTHAYNDFSVDCKVGYECKSDFLTGVLNGVISGCGLESKWNACSGRSQ